MIAIIGIGVVIIVASIVNYKFGYIDGKKEAFAVIDEKEKKDE